MADIPAQMGVHIRADSTAEQTAAAVCQLISQWNIQHPSKLAETHVSKHSDTTARADIIVVKLIEKING